MTSPETLLSGAPGQAPRVHAEEADYKSWVYEYIPQQWARWHRDHSSPKRRCPGRTPRAH